uniref:Uncharacterized protein n=1 Tax=Meloidogyne javanica TaxID=6303 RepID=A0A915N3J3_MELJA
MDIKSFWVGFSVKGIRLEEALDFAGFVVLEKDLSFKSDGTKMRNVHIKHHQDDTCKETTTTTATTTTPTTTTMIKNGEVAANSEYVNSTILSAVFVVRNGHSRILDAEEGYAQIMAQTIGFLNPDFNNTETANNNGKELSDYSAEAAYNFTLARVTLLEFEKEKFATYELGELAFKTIEELEEVISENL